MDLDTFVTTLYVLVDDWYKGRVKARMQRHAGAELTMSDSEVLTLALANRWQAGTPWKSERGLVRYMQKHGRHWFPRMLGRSQFNQRVRELWSVMVCLQQDILRGLLAEELYEVVDCTPLPHCSLAQGASHDRHWLNGRLGRGGNDGGWFFGEQLLVSVTQSGIVTGWLVGQAHLDDRWMLEAFLSTRHGHMRLIEPPLPERKQSEYRMIPLVDSFSPAITVGAESGVPYLADEGFNGQRWIAHWIQEYGVEVISSPPKNVHNAWSREDKRWLSRHRQIIETVFSRLRTVFNLKQLNAHSDWGKVTRLATIMAAYNFGILLNRLLNRPDGALETLIV